MARPDIDGIEAYLQTITCCVAEESRAVIAYARELEAWANRMPDAGITIDDPRLQWWYERPCAPLSTRKKKVKTMGEQAELVNKLQARIESLYDEAHAVTTVPVSWKVRGIGNDVTPGCFCCLDESERLYQNISAFVQTKEDGAMIVAAIGQGARLDYREREPNWIQVKVGACTEHFDFLTHLSHQWFVGREQVRLLRQAAAHRDRLNAEKVLRGECDHVGLWRRVN